MDRRTRWVIANVAGLAFAGFLLHFPGSPGGFYRWDTSAVIFGLILGAISGVILGLIQAGLLTSRRAALGLVGTMAIGVGVSHGLADGSPASLPLVALAAAGGVALAAGLVLCLGEHRPAVVAVWGLAWTAGWLVADKAIVALGLTGGTEPIDWSIEHAAFGVIMALVWGVSTALVGLPEAIDDRRDRRSLDGALADA